MSKYPCTSCGACCRRIDKAVAAIHKLGIKIDFPYKWNEKGVCENLTQDNLCKVYEHRPIICDIDRFAEFMKLDKDKFYRVNIIACNEMIKQDKLPQKYIIDDAKKNT